MTNLTSVLLRAVLFSLALFSFLFESKAQELARMPKNYMGLLAGIEWNTISGLSGVEYERILFSGNDITLGVKGTYIFPYKTGNMQLLSRPCCSVATIGTGLATVDYFTSQNGYPSGFFLHAGLGVGMKTYRAEQSPVITQLRPAFEAGIGWHFYLGRSIGLKWTNTITFPSKDAGVTISRLALGL